MISQFFFHLIRFFCKQAESSHEHQFNSIRYTCDEIIVINNVHLIFFLIISVTVSDVANHDETATNEKKSTVHRFGFEMQDENYFQWFSFLSTPFRNQVRNKNKSIILSMRLEAEQIVNIRAFFFGGSKFEAFHSDSR